MLLVFIVLHPTTAEKWGVGLWRGIYFLIQRGGKRIVKHDIQGRINAFSQQVLAKEIANWEPVGIDIVWIKAHEKPEDFFKDNKLVVRMRHHQDQDRNFLFAAMVFISKSVLTKAKKYLSSNQKESFDLFICKKLCMREKPRVLEKFFDDYFAPSTDASKRITELLSQYEIIDRVGMFYGVLVQELNFLGEKVFLKPRSGKIVEEVTHLINFLEQCSNREIGDETVETNFEGKYCRCGIVIIAKQIMRILGDTKPYVNYIDELIGKNIENIYLVGPAEPQNKELIERVVLETQQRCGYLEQFSKTYKAKLKKKGKRIEKSCFLILIRSPNVIDFYDEEMEATLFGD